MEGTGNRPDYVQEGVAEEAAIGLAVSNAWLNENSTSSDYITRRYVHMYKECAWWNLSP